MELSCKSMKLLMHEKKVWMVMLKKNELITKLKENKKQKWKEIFVNEYNKTSKKKIKIK